MNIVVLDGSPLDEGGLSWEKFKEFGNLTVFEHTDFNKIEERIKDAEIVLTNKTPLSGDLLKKLKKLEYIGVLATGYNVVDIKTAAELGIKVTNVPAYGTQSVAELVFAHILNYFRGVHLNIESVRKGQWTNNRDFSYWVTSQNEIYNKTIGIIGFGRIGRQVAKIAAGFGMKIIAYDKFRNDELKGAVDYKWGELDDVLRNSDIISLHCPLFPEVAGIINKKNIAKMKQSAVLINTSRGGLINEEELTEALNTNKIAAAFLDVLNEEPPGKECVLFKAKNCFITPHIAWAAEEARSRLMNTVYDNIKGFYSGKAINVIC